MNEAPTETTVPPWSRIQTEAFLDRALNLTDTRVLGVVAAHISKKTGTAWPSIRRIADILRIDARNVRRSLRKLENAGYLETAKRANEKGRQTSNAYRLRGVSSDHPSTPDREGASNPRKEGASGQPTEGRLEPAEHSSSEHSSSNNPRLTCGADALGDVADGEAVRERERWKDAVVQASGIDPSHIMNSERHRAQAAALDELAEGAFRAGLDIDAVAEAIKDAKDAKLDANDEIKSLKFYIPMVQRMAEAQGTTRAAVGPDSEALQRLMDVWDWDRTPRGPMPSPAEREAVAAEKARGRKTGDPVPEAFYRRGAA